MTPAKVTRSANVNVPAVVDGKIGVKPPLTLRYDPPSRFNTFPSRIPLFSMDRIYVRGFRCVATAVPRGTAWARMSDHLPLVAELALA